MAKTKQKIEWYELNDQEVRAMLYDRKGKVIAYLTNSLENIKYYYTEDKYEYIHIEVRA